MNTLSLDFISPFRAFGASSFDFMTPFLMKPPKLKRELGVCLGHPDKMSAWEGEGGNGKADIVREVEFYGTKQFQMWTRRGWCQKVRIFSRCQLWMLPFSNLEMHLTLTTDPGFSRILSLVLYVYRTTYGYGAGRVPVLIARTTKVFCQLYNGKGKLTASSLPSFAFGGIH